jgi:hypothetical protein
MQTGRFACYISIVFFPPSVFFICCSRQFSQDFIFSLSCSTLVYVFLTVFIVSVRRPSSLRTCVTIINFQIYFLPVKMIIDYLNVSTTAVFFVILPLLYFIYYRKFRYFIFDQRDKVTKGKTSRGKCPPFFPNGKKLKTD